MNEQKIIELAKEAGACVVLHESPNIVRGITFQLAGDLTKFASLLLQANGVQEGYVMVPKKSTHEMNVAGFHKSQDPKALIADIYKAMIAAAPTLKDK